MDMVPGSEALVSALFAAPGLDIAAESHGNPWWLWIVVFVVLAAFAGFMLWWWLHDAGEEGGVAPTRQAETPPPTPTPVPAQPDELKRIEGIGPRISGVLQAAGITTFRQLANTGTGQIREILEAADPNLLRLADPTTWPEQAALAAEGDWQALEVLQDELKGGRRA
jgi:predicted flap endonuclease-1-like 5' DNA nuclease